jgi:hypothetical protein
MTRNIRFTIKGSGAETDAPTVADLLDQVRDYFDIMNSVEQSVAADGTNAIDWRVVDAHRQSPLAFELEPFPRAYGVSIEQRVEKVVQQTANGLALLRTKAERPPYFTEKALQTAERMFERVMNGLSLTEIDHGPGLPSLLVTPKIARTAAANTTAVLRPASRPYKEIGSVEGYFKSVERDGFGRQLLYLRSRLTGDDIKCVAFEGAARQLESCQIRDVWRNRRLLVSGTIHYRALGRITQVDAVSVRFLRDRHELPGTEDIYDDDFTGGLKSEDYLDRLRDGNLS